MTDDLRPGEVAMPFDPGAAGHTHLHFIGRLRTPWARGNCPKNLTEARARGGDFRALVDTPFRPGLAGLAAGQAVILL